MLICPNVVSSCCTIQDELKIKEFWNKKTAVKFRAYHQKIARLSGRFLGFLRIYQKMGVEKIKIRYPHT